MPTRNQIIFTLFAPIHYLMFNNFNNDNDVDLFNDFILVNPLLNIFNNETQHYTHILGTIIVSLVPKLIFIIQSELF